MLIEAPKEIKNHEYRIGLTPLSVRELVSCGHRLIVEHNGGLAIGFTDRQYLAAGAVIAENGYGDFQTGRYDREGQGATAG